MGQNTVKRFLLTLALLISVIGPVAVSLSGVFGADWLWSLSWLAWAPVGYIILLRRPGNAVGAATLVVGATMGGSFLALAAAVADWLPLDVRVWAELTNLVFGVIPWLGIVWLVLVFPSGSLQGHGERLVSRAMVLFGILAATAFLLDPALMEETGVPSPLAVPALGPLATFITVGPGFLVVVALLISGLILLVRRSRRSTGMERAQFRWLLFGVMCFVFVVTISQFMPEDSAGRFLFFPAGLAIPVTIGIAITRYRLYEIDRVVTRTLSYAVVISLLGLVVLGLVGVMTVFLPSSDPVVVAAATLTVFVLFSPVRRRVQRLVERHFNRSQYDAERVIDEFAGSLRDEIDPEEVVDGWVSVVSETMEPATVGVWVRR